MNNNVGKLQVFYSGRVNPEKCVAVVTRNDTLICYKYERLKWEIDTCEGNNKTSRYSDSGSVP